MTNEIKSLNTLWSLFLEKIPQQLSIRTKSGHKHFHMLVWLCQLKHGLIIDPPKTHRPSAARWMGSIMCGEKQWVSYSTWVNFSLTSRVCVVGGRLIAKYGVKVDIKACRTGRLGGGRWRETCVKENKKHHRLVHLNMFEEFQRTEMSKQWLMFSSSSRVIHNWHH